VGSKGGGTRDSRYVMMGLYLRSTLLHCVTFNNKQHDSILLASTEEYRRHWLDA
jgi:hypothetical protein